MAAVHFAGADTEAPYRAWLGDNPSGLVLNAHLRPTGRYLKLHRVGSRCLAYDNPTLRYSKTCGSREEISDWAMAWFGASPFRIDDCSRCFRVAPSVSP